MQMDTHCKVPVMLLQDGNTCFNIVELGTSLKFKKLVVSQILLLRYGSLCLEFYFSHLPYQS